MRVIPKKNINVHPSVLTFLFGSPTLIFLNPFNHFSECKQFPIESPILLFNLNSLGKPSHYISKTYCDRCCILMQIYRSYSSCCYNKPPVWVLLNSDVSFASISAIEKVSILHFTIITVSGLKTWEMAFLLLSQFHQVDSLVYQVLFSQLCERVRGSNAPLHDPHCPQMGDRAGTWADLPFSIVRCLKYPENQSNKRWVSLNVAQTFPLATLWKSHYSNAGFRNDAQCAEWPSGVTHRNL